MSLFLLNFKIEHTQLFNFLINDKFNLKGLKIVDKYCQLVDYEILLDNERLFKGNGIWKFNIDNIKNQELHNKLEKADCYKYLKCHNFKNIQIKLKKNYDFIILTILEGKYGDQSRFPIVKSKEWDENVIVKSGIINFDTKKPIDLQTREEERISKKINDK